MQMSDDFIRALHRIAVLLLEFGHLGREEILAVPVQPTDVQLGIAIGLVDMPNRLMDQCETYARPCIRSDSKRTLVRIVDKIVLLCISRYSFIFFLGLKSHS